MQQDVLSPSYAFLDFDFSEFIDKNFDMSSDIFNSPSTTNSSLFQLDDFLSCSDDSESKSNYTHESPSLYPLWSNMQNLMLHKTPPTLSCIDDFIKDPQSDLVQLVQQCQNERSLFHNLITHGLDEHDPITPHQILQQEQQLQQKQKEQQQQQQLQQLHQLQLQQQQLQQQQQQHQKLPLQQQQHQQLILQQRSYHPYPATQSPKQLISCDLPIYPPEKSERKRKTTSNSAQPKRIPKSTSSNNNYTHSDSVNAQLLRELIKQAGRNHTQTIDNTSLSDSNQKSTHGNYQTYRHHPYYKPSSTSSRYNIPNHIQTKKSVKQQQPQPQLQQQKTVVNRTPVPKSNHHHSMGRPSMYASDISHAQLLEIQAISRAQQDFIRAREQREAEKEMIMKQQQKNKTSNM